MSDLDPDSCIPLFNGMQYGKTYDWYPPDTKKKFEESNSEYWDEDSITYRVNSHGFRGDDLHPIKSDSFIALGCSCTFGVGVTEEQSWPSVLSKSLDMHGYNLGAPGCGVETMFRLLKYWLPILKSKHVFLLTSPGVRREFFNMDVMPHMYRTISSWSTEVDVHRFLNEREAAISKSRALYAIKGLCDSHNVSLDILETSVEDVIDGLTRPLRTWEEPFRSTGQSNLGRDLLHPGPIYHSLVAKEFQVNYGN
jgi:hypothetical protein